MIEAEFFNLVVNGGSFTVVVFIVYKHITSTEKIIKNNTEALSKFSEVIKKCKR